MNPESAFSLIRVLIVEDHPLVRAGLRDLLQRQADMQIVAETEYGDEALRLVEEQAPDVVVLDLMLDNSPISGLETIRRMTTTSPSSHIVVLSAYFDDDLVFQALLNGAIGYLLKRGDTDEVLDAVRGAAKGYYHLNPLVIQKILDRLQPPPSLSSGESVSEGVPVQDPLTDRERCILPLLAQGLTNKQIAAHLMIAAPTVKTHVSNILRKLGLTRRQEALRALARYQQRQT
jgi:DNA-binding NarL/FixJ family response regulator